MSEEEKALRAILFRVANNSWLFAVRGQDVRLFSAEEAEFASRVVERLDDEACDVLCALCGR